MADKCKSFGLSVAVFVLLFFHFAPNFPGLTQAGQSTIGLTLFFLILLVSEALPITLASLLTVGLIPVFGVSEWFADAVLGFSHPVIFFIIASFAIAGAIMNVPLPRRILLFLVIRTRPNVEMVLLSMMVATAVVSFFISNVPACAIMMVVALEFVGMTEDGPAKKSLGKTFMIAIPVATMIGGIATPASSSLNLLALGILYGQTGMTVSFIHWMIIGVPLVVVLIPLAWLLMIKVYKPHQIDEERVREYRHRLEHEVNSGFSKKEMLVLIIMSVTLVLWIGSSWVESIEIFTVSLLCAVVFMMPGVQVISPKKFVESINWDVIFICGTVLSLAAAFVTNGVSSWIGELATLVSFDFHVMILVGFAAFVSFMMLLIITSAPALITVLAAPLIAIALAGGISPAYVIIALAICAGNCYLLPLDTVQLITYSKGYYRMTDMSKSTIFLQLVIVVLLALWIPFIGGILGI